MRISAVESVVVSFPPPAPLVSSSATIDAVDCVVVTVHTDEGLSGTGYIYILGNNPITPMKEVVDYLAPVITGADPWQSTSIWERMWSSTSFIGPRGVPCFAIAAIDSAIWDIKGKRAGIPVHALLGTYADRIPAYYSGLFVNATIDQLIQEARQQVSDGWWILKMRIDSRRTVEANEERVRAVREALGDDVILLADASRDLDPWTAIRTGRMLQEYNFGWFEDPVSPDEPDAHATVAAALDIPVASGELAYSRHDFRQMHEKQVADIWMPDLERVGGITEWVRVAAMAYAAGIPMANHVFHEISIHVLAALPHALYLEYLPLWEPLFVESIEIDGGYATVPSRPGLGLTLDWDFIDNHRRA